MYCKAWMVLNVWKRQRKKNEEILVLKTLQRSHRLKRFIKRFIKRKALNAFMS